MVKVSSDNLKKKVQSFLAEIELSQEEIDSAIRSWEYAALSEKFSHGFDRAPWLKEIIKQGKVIPKSVTILEENGLVTKIKGNKSLGYSAAEKAVSKVISLCSKHGVGFVTMVDCYPTGCIGQYTEMITKSEFIGLVISHSPARVAPHGSTEAVFGTSGHSFGFPSDNVPYIYDSSVGAITNGEIMLRKKTDQALPQKSVYTKQGELTTNPNEVVNTQGIFEGVIAVAGGPHSHKVSGLAGSLELLANLAVLGEKGNNKAYSIFIAIDPTLFGDKKEYFEKTKGLQQRIMKAKPNKKTKTVLFAGQQSYRKRQKNKLQQKIAISDTTYSLLWKEK